METNISRVDVIVFEIDGNCLYLTPQEAHQQLDNMIAEGDTSEYKVWWGQITEKEFSELPEFEGY